MDPILPNHYNPLDVVVIEDSPPRLSSTSSMPFFLSHENPNNMSSSSDLPVHMNNHPSSSNTSQYIPHFQNTSSFDNDDDELNDDDFKNKGGRKRKTLPSDEEKREKERQKKARWRAKRKERENLSHHFEMTHTALPPPVWKRIKELLQIPCNGSAEDENSAFVMMLHAIGYEWDAITGELLRAPNMASFEKLQGFVPSDLQRCPDQSSSSNNL